MRTLPIFILLVLAVVVMPASAALSSGPVVEIVSAQLPKVIIRISNSDKTVPCIIWAPGVSWEWRSKWYSLRRAAGEKVWELRPKLRGFTPNYPKPQVIPAGGSAAFSHDFSDGTWELPKGFTPGDWKYEMRAHLEIRRDMEAHRYGVFTGHVTSVWQNYKGLEVEKAAPPVLDEKRADVEARTDFPMERLLTQLRKWSTGNIPEKESIGDFLGTDFPWGQCECCYYDTHDLVVLLPEQTLLFFRFYNEQAAASRTTIIKGKPLRDVHRDWLPAQETLAEKGGRRLHSILLSKGKEHASVFKVAFDGDGRVDEKRTEELGR
jgi:hypothetical protein